MASGDKVYIADKATLDSVKADTTEIKGTAETILSELKGQRPKRYGYRVKISEGDPSARVEYLFDAVGMTPAKMNFSSGAFDYGSWADVWFVRDNYPCMLRYDGTEGYRLNPNNYAQKLPSGSSDVAKTTYAGNAMSAIPLIWVKRYEENGYQYVIFCEQQYDEGYHAYAHTDETGTVKPYAYHAIFNGKIVDGKLRSISGLTLGDKTTADEEITAAKATNTEKNFNIRYWSLNELLFDMCTMIGKSTDMQGVFGQGNSNSSGLLATGTLNTRSQFYGASTTATAVKVFHIENLWAQRYERVVGCIYKNAVWRVKMTPEGSGYNLTGEGYYAVHNGTSQTSSGGYVKETKQTEYGKFPVSCSGSDSTYECAYHYCNNSIVAVLVVGGSYGAGSGCGRYLGVAFDASGAWGSVGASLSYV